MLWSPLTHSPIHVCKEHSFLFVTCGNQGNNTKGNEEKDNQKVFEKEEKTEATGYTYKEADAAIYIYMKCISYDDVKRIVMALIKRRSPS